MAQKRKKPALQARHWNPPESLPLGFELSKTSVYGRFVVYFMHRPIGFIERVSGSRGQKWLILPDLNAPPIKSVARCDVALKYLKIFVQKANLSPDRNREIVSSA